MPTPSEQKALAFLAFVLLLGGAMRVVHASAAPTPTAAEQQALARQTDAALNAAAQQRPRKGGTRLKMSRRRRDDVVDTVAGVAGIPRSDVRPDRWGGTPRQYNPRDGWVNGYPPPSPRIDSGNRPEQRESALPIGSRASNRGRPVTPDTQHVDLDVADARAIDALPRIGPALAARLVANRDSFGPFGSLDALRRVRGIGPATLQTLAPRVTFSGRPASLTAGSRYH